MKKINFSSEYRYIDRWLTSRKFIRPRRDWIIILIFTAIALVGVLSYDAFTYFQITDGDIYVSVNKNDLLLEPLQTDQLKGLLSGFQNRTQVFSHLKVGTQIDPSL